jgi:large subunit ribosomal protein L11
MAKKIKALLKLQIPAGKATPAPPVGPALGQHGLAIQDFCSQFNAKTADKAGDVIPVVITVYEDRSFDFVTKTPPASELIKKAIGLAKGSGKPHMEKVGKMTNEQLRSVAERKLPDLNTDDVEQAMKVVAGTARQMGVLTDV